MRACETWGLDKIVLVTEDEDVVMLFENPIPYKTLKHGYVNRTQIDLSLHDAKKLLESLREAIDRFEKIDNTVC